ncbi:hypothetical protein [Comamonas sp. GB3 AK4-5]|uniref:hypothetical protein n=1 Tax=Comamonas sp. GB3 AK4-5 TaxID=3231487 RepID=UPI00351EBFEB
MSEPSFSLSPDLLALLHAPVSGERPTPAEFFAQPEVSALYTLARDPAHSAAALQALAGLLPELPPYPASLLALMSGSLVESGADPTLLFPCCLTLMQRWQERLAPYCAREVEEEEAQDDPQAAQAWADTQARVEALDGAEADAIDELFEAVELLVLPMMTMVLRDEGNHQRFLANPALQEHIASLHDNDSLPFEQLYFLWLAACVSYENELVVVLPATGTGLVVRAHGVNNNFHTFTLLQQLMAEHQQPLGITLTATHDGNGADRAAFAWLQATAYAQGKLVNEMAWSWGEAPLRHNARRLGRCVLIALDKKDACRRNWSGFDSACHEAQNPHLVFQRYLTPEEVAAFLD